MEDFGEYIFVLAKMLGYEIKAGEITAEQLRRYVWNEFQVYAGTRVALGLSCSCD